MGGGLSLPVWAYLRLGPDQFLFIILINNQNKYWDGVIGGEYWAASEFLENLSTLLKM